MRRPRRARADALRSVSALGRERRLGAPVRGAGAERWTACRTSDRQFFREDPSLRLRRKKGERHQAIGRSRGGRTTRVHALTDAACRPVAFVLTGGTVADCTAAVPLLAQVSNARLIHGDKGSDTNAVRRQIEDKGAAPNIPPKANWIWTNCFSPVLYRT